MTAARQWAIPSWAVQSSFTPEDGTASHYSSEGDPLAYAVLHDTGDGQHANDLPELMVRLGDDDLEALHPKSGQEVRELAVALLRVAHVWDTSAEGVAE